MASPASDPEISRSTIGQLSKRKNSRKSSIPESDPVQSPLNVRMASFFGTSSVGYSNLSDRSDFNYAQNCFIPSILSIVTFGFTLHFAYVQFSSTIIMYFVVILLAWIMWEWMDLYGANISRAERLVFDISNILATSTNFDFNKSPDPSDPPTPNSPDLLAKLNKNAAPHQAPNTKKAD